MIVCVFGFMKERRIYEKKTTTKNNAVYGMHFKCLNKN